VTIFEFGAADVRERLDELAQLLLDAHADGMGLGLAAPLTLAAAGDAWLETAARLDPRDHVLLAALEDDAIVGSVQVVRARASNGRHRGEVVRLAVRADARGRGLGRALMERATERARELGFTLLWLTTHVDTTADRFYERLGWTRMGVMPGYAVLPDGTLAANAYFYREL
jgi:GNAT superfamily N-acetyltransferase